jgi:hypothetical protein
VGGSTASFLKSQLQVVVAHWPEWLVGCAKTVPVASNCSFTAVRHCNTGLCQHANRGPAPHLLYWVRCLNHKQIYSFCSQRPHKKSITAPCAKQSLASGVACPLFEGNHNIVGTSQSFGVVKNSHIYLCTSLFLCECQYIE